MTPPLVLVTGASRGLGRGIALVLAQAGYSVAVNYAGNRAKAEETCTLCAEVAPDSAQQFLPFQADVGNADDRARMLDEIAESMGQIDALINNAGIGTQVRGDLLDATEDSWDKVLQTNLKGPYFLTQAVARTWVRENQTAKIASGFKVVFVTSISAYTASINRGDYCISKAGLSMAVQLFATRLAAEGIHVFELRPGIMKSDMTSAVTAKYDALIADGLVPQARWGTGDDLGRAVRGLLSDDWTFSTGTVIDVDGGFRIQRL